MVRGLCRGNSSQHCASTCVELTDYAMFGNLLLTHCSSSLSPFHLLYLSPLHPTHSINFGRLSPYIFLVPDSSPHRFHAFSCQHTLLHGDLYHLYSCIAFVSLSGPLCSFYYWIHKKLSKQASFLPRTEYSGWTTATNLPTGDITPRAPTQWFHV